MGKIGDIIKRIREERGISQSDLAKKAGVRPTIISNLENDYAQNSKYLPYIAKALEVKVAELDPELWAALRETDQMPNQEDSILDPEGLLDLLFGSYVAFGMKEDDAVVLARAIVKSGRRLRSQPSPFLDSDQTRKLGERLARAFLPG
jgi:transcriptional regulator with XRE-family HTH domain